MTLRAKIEEILNQVDPNGIHISEDSRIHIKDAILEAVREMMPEEMEYKNFNNEVMESWNACREKMLEELK